MTDPKLEKNIGIGFIFVAWGIGFGLLTYFFHNWYAVQENPNQNVATTLHPDGSKELVIKRNKYSHYVVSGKINKKPVTFFLDTGATVVVIPLSVAKKLGLQNGAPSTASTAAGNVTVYNTKIDSIEIGNLLLKNVRASISPSMEGNQILLGMSALKHLELIQKGDELILRLPRD